MRYRYIFSVGLLLSLSYVCLQAQTRQSAIDRYHDGGQKLEAGDWNGAIEDFTRAIEISSRLEGVKSSLSSPRTNGFTAASDDRNNITVVDPLTANAYTSRGLARYRQGDVDGAIADWDAAIRLHPGLPRPYTNRGSARYLKGDLEGALADLDHAIQINPQLAEAYCNRGAVRLALDNLEGRWPILIKRSL
jgi:tetratricopeptide (TPR) repeat protein